MTNRRDYHQRTQKDLRARGRFVSLTEHMLGSAAWQALDGNCRALYVELARRYRARTLTMVRSPTALEKPPRRSTSDGVRPSAAFSAWLPMASLG